MEGHLEEVRRIGVGLEVQKLSMTFSQLEDRTVPQNGQICKHECTANDVVTGSDFAPYFHAFAFLPILLMPPLNLYQNDG